MTHTRIQAPNANINRIPHQPSQLPRRSNRIITRKITTPALPARGKDHTPRPAILRRPLDTTLNLKRQLDLRDANIRIIQRRLQHLNIVIEYRSVVDVRDGDGLRDARGHRHGAALVHHGVLHRRDDVDVLPLCGRHVVDCDVPVDVPEDARDADAAGAGAGAPGVC